MGILKDFTTFIVPPVVIGYDVLQYMKRVINKYDVEGYIDRLKESNLMLIDNKFQEFEDRHIRIMDDKTNFRERKLNNISLAFSMMNPEEEQIKVESCRYTRGDVFITREELNRLNEFYDENTWLETIDSFGENSESYQGKELFKSLAIGSSIYIMLGVGYGILDTFRYKTQIIKTDNSQYTLKFETIDNRGWKEFLKMWVYPPKGLEKIFEDDVYYLKSFESRKWNPSLTGLGGIFLVQEENKKEFDILKPEAKQQGWVWDEDNLKNGLKYKAIDTKIDNLFRGKFYF